MIICTGERRRTQKRGEREIDVGDVVEKPKRRERFGRGEEGAEDVKVVAQEDRGLAARGPGLLQLGAGVAEVGRTITDETEDFGVNVTSEGEDFVDHPSQIGSRCAQALGDVGWKDLKRPLLAVTYDDPRTSTRLDHAPLFEAPEGLAEGGSTRLKLCSESAFRGEVGARCVTTLDDRSTEAVKDASA